MEETELQTSAAAKETRYATESTPPQWLLYLEIIVKWRKFIAITTLSATLIAVVVSFLLPVWYQASSVILLSSSSDLFGISKLLGGGGAFEGLLGKGKADDAERYEAIFKSERLRLAIIEKFNLIHEYEFDEEGTREPIKNTLKELDQNISFKENKDGSITITAWYKQDSVKAAEMANFIVAMMDSTNRLLATESARNQRVFIEKRYQQALQDLKAAEERLNQFQKEYKVAEVKDQVRASLEASAQLEASAVQSEVEYNVLRKTLGESNPQVAVAKSRIEELRRQSKKFELGGLASDIIIPFNKMPDVAMAYLRLYRDVLLQTKIVEFLVPQYEQAKIQEAKDTPNLLVLDKARVPEWKSKPKRLFIIAGTFIGALVLAVLIAIAIEFFSEMQSASPQTSLRLKRIWQMLRNGKSQTA
ncbi:MAG: GNVR domain-containing protein [Chloroherpetonaceae bacterium]